MSFRLPLIEDEPWRDEAACHGMDPAIFHPEVNYRQHWERYGRVPVPQDMAAKAVCAICPVTADCLDYAERTHTREVGIYGGLNPPERQRLRRRRQQRRGAA